jgi:hypothetical protein
MPAFDLAMKSNNAKANTADNILNRSAGRELGGVDGNLAAVPVDAGDWPVVPSFGLFYPRPAESSDTFRGDTP